MENWRKTSTLEPFPLKSKLNEKRKLEVGNSSHNKKTPTVVLPVDNLKSGDFRRPADESKSPAQPPDNVCKEEKENEQQRLARKRVMDILHKFREYCDRLSDMKQKGSNEKKKSIRRIDFLAAQMVKREIISYYTVKQYLGPVPGVKIGDEFYYRMELHILGLHRPPQAGIDTMDYGGEKIAVSVVASRGYNDCWKDANTLIYSGQGGNGNGSGNRKQVDDQILKGGNLALMNSKRRKNPVRVIKGRTSDQCRTIFTYDGLYTVEDLWVIRNLIHRKRTFKYKLVKISGQS